ncbi:MAG: hypothetical protein Ta2A_03180 [Treponemataceae bacterium]|nr:MAG: hypothetical protein Ta2A_03180 [Treponemataceae bacterium]
MHAVTSNKTKIMRTKSQKVEGARGNCTEAVSADGMTSVLSSIDEDAEDAAGEAADPAAVTAPTSGSTGERSPESSTGLCADTTVTQKNNAKKTVLLEFSHP